MNDQPAAQPISADQFFTIYRFLCRESNLLSAGDYNRWFQLLEPTIEYRVQAPSFLDPGRKRVYGLGKDYFIEDWYSLKIRVEQLTTPNYTIAENPPSIIRHIVTNIDGVVTEDGYEVTSNVLVYRVRATDPHPAIVTGWRRDLLREGAGGMTLMKRLAQIDQVSLQQPNFSVFV
jgi:3-phenylpropionate/cinnamic acid dioxygenase small subunit